jgi:hypothetical protein
VPLAITAEVRKHMEKLTLALKCFHLKMTNIFGSYFMDQIQSYHWDRLQRGRRETVFPLNKQKKRHVTMPLN